MKDPIVASHHKQLHMPGHIAVVVYICGRPLKKNSHRGAGTRVKKETEEANGPPQSRFG